MAKEIEAIGVSTSGGGVPGMNVAIHAMVRTALHYGMKVKGIMRGYSDLLDEEFIDMNARSVADIINRGGTILYAARCMGMMTEEGQRQATEICKRHGIDGVVVIGGDDSFKDAGRPLKLGINAIGVLGTIDLDIACIKYTVGLGTAVNTAIDAIDKVRDTSTSHERCSIIEVVGRHVGYIVLWSGIATSSDAILIPEHYDGNKQETVNHIIASRKHGKKHFIIINAEGIGHSSSMAKRIEVATGTETRATILGYMQCDGSPSCKGCFHASIMGSKAVDLLAEGKSNRLVVHRNGKFCDFDTEEALRMKKDIPAYQLELSAELTC